MPKILGLISIPQKNEEYKERAHGKTVQQPLKII
jgi:hypothetical protein